MSDFSAIRAASQTLQSVLNAALQAQFGVNVLLQTPREMTTLGVSLWLYRVVRDEFLTNQPPVRIAPDRERRTPLPVILHYLVTPLIGNNSEQEQLVLGKILEVFYDHPVMRNADLQGGLDVNTVELRVTLETLSLEEITRVWNALSSETGYQLSLSYQVQVIEIDSARPPDSVVPVEELDTRYHVIVGHSDS